MQDENKCGVFAVRLQTPLNTVVPAIWTDTRSNTQDFQNSTRLSCNNSQVQSDDIVKEALLSEEFLSNPIVRDINPPVTKQMIYKATHASDQMSEPISPG